MKLKDEFGKLPKGLVYDMYLSLVYECKNYDDITRTKMLESIIKEHSQEHFIYHLCTEKELNFLKYVYHKKLNRNDIKKYEWEINTLNKKCIFSKVTYEIFEEQKNNVERAVKEFEKYPKKSYEELIMFMISVIKINVEMLTKALSSMVKSITNVTEEDVDRLLGSPLFKFYCGFYDEYFEFSNKEEEVIIYRDYWDYIDDLKEARKNYGIAGAVPFDIKDYLDIFYYGFPIRKEKVKKMYEEVNKLAEKDLIYMAIEDARLFNNRQGIDLFVNDEKLKKVINEALDEIPCAAMNGFTPKQYEEELEKETEFQKDFNCTAQRNAHLSKKEADEYYKLYFSLLEYTNNKYNISPSLKRIYKQEGLDVNKLYPIDEYLWQHKEIIDDFIKENKYKFKNEQLEIIKGFKTAVTSDNFIIVGFEEEYTKILSEEGKIYMVKGIRTNMDEIIDPDDTPIFIKTTLLMYKDNIIFNSFFASMPISFGNDMKEAILENCKNAIPYYHL